MAAATQSVSESADEIGMSDSSFYVLRNATTKKSTKYKTLDAALDAVTSLGKSDSWSVWAMDRVRVGVGPNAAGRRSRVKRP